MKVAFLGDSITKGVPKVSYFEMLLQDLDSYELTNYGKGGDTVDSLLKRIKKIKHLEEYDLVFVFIGVNDVYSKINRKHEVMKALRRQYWSKDNVEFRALYYDLIKYLDTKCRKVVIIPPLLFGENLKSKWNEELKEYIEVIKDILKEYPHIDYLDVYSAFVEYLKDKEVVDYIPESLFRTGMDAAVLVNNQLADQESDERGLHLTLDGVHLNSKGAKLTADIIADYIKTTC
ncbi:GDSL-like Lipase/Acylhydrolase [Candidatus Izimaplasma bacterium HR1]|jgi:lysophospholipase L1-like esterase|uniref:SGNH/GDSL hydrolase family protein n=1 Tax=Candidatus Izimoplasma sp. HR1 TaxID=1541959 RepID=UPI0004F7E932|nr:GDSL-like Lipase/Acylhydrolase [Candidatus Izimaplasma bacterium HR1]